MPTEASEAWLALALSRPVVGIALRTSLVVGAILNAINQGPALLAGEVHLVGLLLNFVVPYCVATYGAVSMRRTRGA